MRPVHPALPNLRETLRRELGDAATLDLWVPASWEAARDSLMTEDKTADEAELRQAAALEVWWWVWQRFAEAAPDAFTWLAGPEAEYTSCELSVMHALKRWPDTLVELGLTAEEHDLCARAKGFLREATGLGAFEKPTKVVVVKPECLPLVSTCDVFGEVNGWVLPARPAFRDYVFLDGRYVCAPDETGPRWELLQTVVHEQAHLARLDAAAMTESPENSADCLELDVSEAFAVVCHLMARAYWRDEALGRPAIRTAERMDDRSRAARAVGRAVGHPVLSREALQDVTEVAVEAAATAGNDEATRAMLNRASGRNWSVARWRQALSGAAAGPLNSG